jgi:hypothetical protein
VTPAEYSACERVRHDIASLDPAEQPHMRHAFIRALAEVRKRGMRVTLKRLQRETLHQRQVIRDVAQAITTMPPEDAGGEANDNGFAANRVKNGLARLVFGAWPLEGQREVARLLWLLLHDYAAYAPEAPDYIDRIREGLAADRDRVRVRRPDGCLDFNAMRLRSRETHHGDEGGAA